MCLVIRVLRYWAVRVLGTEVSVCLDIRAWRYRVSVCLGIRMLRYWGVSVSRYQDVENWGVSVFN